MLAQVVDKIVKGSAKQGEFYSISISSPAKNLQGGI